MKIFFICSNESKNFIVKYYFSLSINLKKIFLKSLIENISDISSNYSAINTIKFIFSKIKSNNELKVISAYTLQYLHSLIENNSNFGNTSNFSFIEIIISNTNLPKIKKIQNKLINNYYFLKMANCKSGYYCLKKLIITLFSVDQLNSIINIIVDNINFFLYSQYGSLIIQTIVKKYSLSSNKISEDSCLHSNAIKKLFDSFKGEVLNMSIGTHSARIVEASIDKGGIYFYTIFSNEIIENFNIEKLFGFAKGFYIIEKAVKNIQSKGELLIVKYSIVNSKANKKIPVELLEKFGNLLMLINKQLSSEFNIENINNSYLTNNKIIENFNSLNINSSNNKSNCYAYSKNIYNNKDTNSNNFITKSNESINTNKNSNNTFKDLANKFKNADYKHTRYKELNTINNKNSLFRNNNNYNCLQAFNITDNKVYNNKPNDFNLNKTNFVNHCNNNNSNINNTNNMFYNQNFYNNNYYNMINKSYNINNNVQNFFDINTSYNLNNSYNNKAFNNKFFANNNKN